MPLPLITGDQVRVRVDLTRPAYVYVLWIDTRGEVFVTGEKLAQLDESANDEDAHLDGAPAL